MYALRFVYREHMLQFPRDPGEYQTECIMSNDAPYIDIVRRVK